MSAIIKRLSDLEADVKDLLRKKSFIPVLFVAEYPEGYIRNIMAQFSITKPNYSNLPMRMER